MPVPPRRHLCRLLLLVLGTSVWLAGPAAAQRPTVTRQLNLPEQKLAHFSVKLVDVAYGDMSSPQASDSAMLFTIKVKNISSEPRDVERALHATLFGMRQFTTDVFYSGVVGDLAPGAERTFVGRHHFSYIQHRTLTSVTITEMDVRSNDERYRGPRLGRVEFQIPPLDPKWVDPDVVQINGPSMALKHWSARVVSMRYPDFTSKYKLFIQPVIVIALKNLTSAPLNPDGFIGWTLNGSGGKKHFLGTFGFNVRDEALVPPGGEMLIYVGNRTLDAEEYRALNAITLTEHNPIGRIDPRTVIARIELPLPPDPRAR